MVSKDKPVKGADIQSLRELLGVSDLDMFWLLGALVPSWRTTGEPSLEPLKQPSLSILVRYLSKYPEAAFLTRLPSLEDIYPLVVKVSDEEKLPARRFGPLWGVSGWTGYSWMKGGNPSQVVQRLFRLVEDAITQDGEEGFRKFLEVVDEEARARGVEGGLDKILQEGSWGVRKRNYEEQEKRNLLDK